MSDALSRHVRSRRPAATPQNELAREDQVKNSAGGFVFATSDLSRLHRFLTIGTEGGTFYVGERELTRDNAEVVTRLAEASDLRLIEQVIAVSEAGRAPSNDPALFALAAAAGLGDQNYRQVALDALPRVARTGTHLLTFTKYAELFRGWGPQLVKGVRNWYLGKDPDALAYQLLKYKQRNGWSQQDTNRLAIFKAAPKHKPGQRWRAGSMPQVPATHEALLRYVAKGTYSDGLPQLVADAEEAHRLSTTPDSVQRTAAWLRLIEGNRSLSWEMLPSEALAVPAVWHALVDNGNLPQTALIRNLARLTTLGLLSQGDTWTKEVANRLSDPNWLVKARVHPINVLLALKTYAQGHGMRGKGTWNPVPVITDAMDAAFYAAFGAVEAAGNRVSVNLDISGSMTAPAGGLPITCREVVAAMGLVTVKTEPLATIHGFGHTYAPLDISPRRRLDDVTRYIAQLGMQRTDCSLPMVTALQERREVDVFQIWTDNETWYGRIHPHQALENYRQGMGRDTRLQVIAITPTEFSIADPLDPRQLDVSGFDAAVPNLLAAHARGEL